MSEDQLDEWIVKNAHDVSIDSEPVWAVFTEDLRGMLNGKVVIDAAAIEQSAADIEALKAENEVLRGQVPDGHVVVPVAWRYRWTAISLEWQYTAEEAFIKAGRASSFEYEPLYTLDALLTAQRGGK